MRDQEAEPTTLSEARAAKFFTALAEHPFVCVVAQKDGTLTIWSKEVSEEDVQRIKSVLQEEERDA